MTDELDRHARSAAKWSLASEMIAKVVTPITQLILARILAPEAFGVLAVVIMVASFAQMIADAGFQKYLVQHEFDGKKDLYQAATVAFWASMSVALVLLLAIWLFRDAIAELVGNPGLGVPIAVASFSIPLTVVVSTQQALFRRAFEYKKLLPIRVAVAATPLLVSVPLALLGFEYWSLIIGVLSSNFINGAAMTLISPWKPRFYFSFKRLRAMFSFSGWTLLEAFSIWATLWSGTFIVGNLLTPYELGLYRQPIVVVNSAFALVTTATTPILFAALSRLQNDRPKFTQFFLRFQFTVALVLFPVGVGAFFYREFFTTLLFGPQWTEASLMFGAWALSTSASIVLSHYYSEIFRALGRPRISFLSQCLYMAVMIPSLYFAASDSFTTLVIVNAVVRVAAIAISQTLAYFVAGIGFLQVTKNLSIPLLAASLMAVLAYFLSEWAHTELTWTLLGILSCAVFYFAFCLCFSRSRQLITEFVFSVRKKA